MRPAVVPPPSLPLTLARGIPTTTPTTTRKNHSDHDVTLHDLESFDAVFYRNLLEILKMNDDSQLEALDLVFTCDVEVRRLAVSPRRALTN